MLFLDSKARLAATGAMLALLAVVFSWVTLSLKNTSEHQLMAQADALRVANLVRAVDSWEWRAISRAAEPDATLANVHQIGTDINEQLDHLADNGVSPSEIASLRKPVNAYQAAVVAELHLLAEGRWEEAKELDEETVDPAFETAMSAMEDFGERMQASARQRHQLSDLMVITTIGGAVATTAMVFWWRLRSDIRRRTQQRESERYRALVDQSADLVVVTADGGGLTYLSPSARRFVDGVLELDVDRVRLTDLVHPEDRETLGRALASSAAGPGTGRFPVRLGHGGTWRRFEVSVRDLTADPAIAGHVLTAHDVTERDVLQQELHHRALHDALTGLPNRVLLGQRIDTTLSDPEAAAAGLLLIDLDRFKEINDTLGHHIGDLLLGKVGPRLQSLVGPEDTVARLGGDEFAVLIANPGSVEALHARAERIRQALCTPFLVESMDLHVEASIGVVLSGEHGSDAATLLKRADIAMYVAKTRGIGVFRYNPAEDHHHPDRLSLLADLRRALDRRELVLHFQPQVSLSTRSISGAEALVRWQHPTRGLLHPDTFIPLAEGTGLIAPLTDQVLELAIAQAARWQAAGRALPVSVNLSARNLLDTRLDEHVAALLDQYGLPARLLVLEVTESAIMSEPQRAVDTLNRLHDRGVRISIDDFGAGYTSISQLQHLPLHELKVDRSFIVTMEGNRSNQLIVRNVVDLGHNLGLNTVAEGVESAEALAELTGYGCDVVQGYHLSGPLPAEEFDRWRATTPLEDLLGPPTDGTTASTSTGEPPSTSTGVPRPRTPDHVAPPPAT